MDDLITWLLEQVAVDEEAARDLAAHQSGPSDWEGGYDDITSSPEYLAVYISPRRVLAGCEAKRRLIDFIRRELTDCDCEADGHHYDDVDLLGFLALPYAHRPGYREEWKP